MFLFPISMPFYDVVDPYFAIRESACNFRKFHIILCWTHECSGWTMNLNRHTTTIIDRLIVDNRHFDEYCRWWQPELNDDHPLLYTVDIYSAADWHCEWTNASIATDTAYCAESIRNMECYMRLASFYSFTICITSCQMLSICTRFYHHWTLKTSTDESIIRW